MPCGQEHEELHAIEDVVEELLGEAGVVVGVVTTRSMREFVIYTAASARAAWLHEQLEQSVSTHEVQLFATHDPT